jgi:hypothetical protein
MKGCVRKGEMTSGESVLRCKLENGRLVPIVSRHKNTETQSAITHLSISSDQLVRCSSTAEHSRLDSKCRAV